MAERRVVLEHGTADRNYWHDLWRYRELVFFLAWRDVAVRYKQTAIGVVWAVLRPALTMAVFVVFRRFVGVTPSAIPDPVLVLAAVLPWQFFSSALSETSGSLIGNTSLISKVYFPRLMIPLATVATSLVDFIVTLLLLAFVMLAYGFAPSWQLLALPLFTLQALALAAGAGLLLSAMNVQYRDFRYVVPFIVQFGLFVSPIAFTSANVPERWRLVYALNPLVGIIDGFRWSLLRGEPPLDPRSVGLSLAITLGFAAYGVRYFRRMERTFADVI